MSFSNTVDLFLFCFSLAGEEILLKIGQSHTGSLNTNITKTAFPLKREICVPTYLQMSKMAALSYNNTFVYPVSYPFMELCRHHRVENGWH